MWFSVVTEADRNVGKARSRSIHSKKHIKTKSPNSVAKLLLQSHLLHHQPRSQYCNNIHLQLPSHSQQAHLVAQSLPPPPPPLQELSPSPLTSTSPKSPPFPIKSSNISGASAMPPIPYPSVPSSQSKPTTAFTVPRKRILSSSFRSLDQSPRMEVETQSKQRRASQAVKEPPQISTSCNGVSTHLLFLQLLELSLLICTLLLSCLHISHHTRSTDHMRSPTPRSRIIST